MIGHACRESNVAESTDDCDEIAAINVNVSMPAPPAQDREDNSFSRSRQSSSFSPVKVQTGGFIGRPITYSPITIHSGQLVQHALPETSQLAIGSGETKSIKSDLRLGARKPGESTNTRLLPSNTVENAAFSRAPRTLVRPTLTHRLCGDPSSLFCSIRGVSSSKPLASLKRHMAVDNGFNAKRPRRKVATAMQDTPATHIPSAEKPDTALSALCHCPACDKSNLSVQGELQLKIPSLFTKMTHKTKSPVPNQGCMRTGERCTKEKFLGGLLPYRVHSARQNLRREADCTNRSGILTVMSDKHTQSA